MNALSFLWAFIVDHFDVISAVARVVAVGVVAVMIGKAIGAVLAGGES